MNVLYRPDFINKLKKVDVRAQKNFRQKIALFQRNPQYPQLRNHQLQREWEGYRSIDITADYRAIYKEISEKNDVIAYFVAFGTHKELYK